MHISLERSNSKINSQTVRQEHTIEWLYQIEARVNLATQCFYAMFDTGRKEI